MEPDFEMGRVTMHLWACGLSGQTVDHIMKKKKHIRTPMLRGIPEETVERVMHYVPPYVWKGTPSTSDVSDLRNHHLTREWPNIKYTSADRTIVTQNTSKVLREQRTGILELKRVNRILQARTCSKSKPDRPRGARQKAGRMTKRQPTILSREVNIDDIDEDGEDDDESMQEYYKSLCERFDDDPSKPIFDENFTRSSMEDTSISREPSSDLVSTEEVGKNIKRKREPAPSPEPATNDLSDHIDHQPKRRKLENEVPDSAMEEKDDYDIEMDKAMEEMLSKDVHEQEKCSHEVISKPVLTEEISKQTKRKRGSPSPVEPPTGDLSDHVDRELKRRMLKSF